MCCVNNAQGWKYAISTSAILIWLLFAQFFFKYHKNGDVRKAKELWDLTFKIILPHPYWYINNYYQKPLVSPNSFIIRRLTISYTRFFSHWPFSPDKTTVTKAWTEVLLGGQRTYSSRWNSLFRLVIFPNVKIAVSELVFDSVPSRVESDRLWYWVCAWTTKKLGVVKLYV